MRVLVFGSCSKNVRNFFSKNTSFELIENFVIENVFESNQDDVFLILETKGQIIFDLYKKIRRSARYNIILFNNSVSSTIQKILQHDERNIFFSLEMSLLELSQFFSEIKEDIEFDFDKTDSYKSLPIFFFRHIEISPVDLFLNVGDNKFIRFCKAGDKYLQEHCERYLSRGMTKFYCKKEFVFELIECLKDAFSSYYMNQMSESVQKLFVKETFEFVHFSLHQIGLTEDVLSLTNDLLDSTYKLLNKHHDLKCFFNNLKNNNFLSEHSLLTSYICVGVSKKIKEMSPQLEEKLVMASLLHDLSIKEERLAQLEQNMKSLNMEEYQSQNFLNHPYKINEILRKIDGLLPDVEEVVLQHHERPDGSGFPRSLKADQIRPIAAAFIVIHQFAVEFHQSDLSKSSMEKIIFRLDKEYDGFCYFKMSVEALKELLGFKAESKKY